MQKPIIDVTEVTREQSEVATAAWTKPSFESFSLNEALGLGGGGTDFASEQS